MKSAALLAGVLLAVSACGPSASVEHVAVGAEVYIEDMWANRAMTVRAGLDEGLEQFLADDRDGAGRTVMAVYAGSFEPELEPLIRDTLNPRRSAALEYRFGLLRDGMQGSGDEVAVRALLEDLANALDQAAAELDAAQATLEDG